MNTPRNASVPPNNTRNTNAGATTSGSWAISAGETDDNPKRLSVHSKFLFSCIINNVYTTMQRDARNS